MIALFIVFIEWCTRETALLYSYFMAGAIWALATDCRSMKLKDCVCRRSNDESNEDGTVIFNDCNANVEYARRFMGYFLDQFVLKPENEENDSCEYCERLSWRNSIYGYNVRLPYT